MSESLEITLAGSSAPPFTIDLDLVLDEAIDLNFLRERLGRWFVE